MSEVAKLVPGILGGGLATVIFLGASYLLRDSILSALNRSIQRDIETKKAGLQKELEGWKAELEVQKEHLKHELSKASMKAQLITAKTHETYAELFELLRKAEGAVGTLVGLRMVPDWAKMEDSEIKSVLASRGAKGSQIDSAIASIDRGRMTGGYKEVEDLSYHLDHFAAEKATREAKNFAILRELYLSKEVSKKVFDLLNLFNSIRIESEMSKMEPKLMMAAYEKSKKLEPSMEELRTSMRTELGAA